jgi:hypothetical protein
MNILCLTAVAVAALGVVTGVSFAQQAAPPESGAPPAQPQTAATPPAGQVAPRVWNVERVQCSSLLGADDDDRASAAMFYYGYLAARAGIHVIDTTKIADNVAKVMKQCAATPNMTVPRAFRTALAKQK